MNNYISDVELAGKGPGLAIVWRNFSRYRSRLVAIIGALALTPYTAPEHSELMFLVELCEVMIRE